MMILPKGAFIVKQDEIVEKEEKIAIILTMEDLKEKPKKPNTGVIIFTSEELNEFQLYRVVFRENFFEKIDVGEYKDLLYFRDFNSSIFYVTK
jgi:hypothetical protein